VLEGSIDPSRVEKIRFAAKRVDVALADADGRIGGSQFIHNMVACRPYKAFAQIEACHAAARHQLLQPGQVETKAARQIGDLAVRAKD